MAAGPILIKLGGSLLTDKRGESQAHSVVIARLAQEVATAHAELPEQLVLGHGSGSFGHVAAQRYDLGQGLVGPTGERQPLVGVSVTQWQAAELHRLLIEALIQAGAEPFSLAPSSSLVASSGQPVSVALEPLRRALDLGLLPVVRGDIVLDRQRGASICSTESVLLALARRLARVGRRPRRVVWAGVTAGVLDDDGRLIPKIDRHSFAAVRRSTGGSAGTDVTGGMTHRLEAARAMARLGIESWILDGSVPGRLLAALRGEPVPATRFVVAENRSRP